MCERLVRTAHDAEADMDIATLHKGRNDGVERPLAAREEVGVVGFERESGAAVVKDKTHTFHGYARAKRRGDALDPADDVTFFVCDCEVRGVAGHCLSRLDRAVRLRGIDQGCAFCGV